MMIVPNDLNVMARRCCMCQAMYELAIHATTGVDDGDLVVFRILLENDTTGKL